MPQILHHVDVRVRDLAVATAFYDAVLSPLGAVKRVGDEYTTWRVPPPGAALEDAPVASDRRPNRGEPSCSGRAKSIEMDDGVYGADFYAVFFEDPDGNRLEICIQ